MITIALLAITSICSQGLSGLPTGFSSLCAELGVASPEWVEYGPEWQNMTRVRHGYTVGTFFPHRTHTHRNRTRDG